jgi:3-phenylpropionate/trans-cinnamate dioxygenase ferredoxin reductase subunit
MADTYVLIGGGVAAATAAVTLREAGADGRIVLVGEEPDAPYERPELSKGFLAGDKERADLAVKPEKWYGDNGVELLLGRRATAIDRADRAVELDDGERLRYDRLLLATGSSPRKLKLPGSDLDGLHYLRRVGNAEAIRTAVAAGGPIVVIGGGWIGLEVAAVARAKGVEVTLLELAPTPLFGVVGEQVGATFVALHRDHGVDVRTGAEVRALRGDQWVEAVELTDGTLLPAAAVVAGVGIRPRTELAEQAGLAVDNGIVVDTRLRTGDPAIWAAGDVANAANGWAGRHLRVEHFANANDQGPFAGRSMTGATDEWATPPFFWSDQYDVGLEYRGWADPATARVVVRGTPGKGPWIAVWLDGDRVAAGLHVNAWDDADAVKALVVDKAAVDVDALADDGRPLESART